MLELALLQRKLLRLLLQGWSGFAVIFNLLCVRCYLSLDLLECLLYVQDVSALLSALLIEQ